MMLQFKTTALLKHICEVMTPDVVDATCVVLKCDYETTYNLAHPEMSPEELVRKNSLEESQYQVQDWSTIKKEIRDVIKEHKDDEIELGRIVRTMLNYLDEPLHMFYSSEPKQRQTIFQRLVPYLLYYQRYSTLPKDIVDIHKEDIDSCIEFGTDVAPANPKQELKKRCEESLFALQHAEESPCFRQCRYFHSGVFRRLAVIIESYLLEYHCKKDLFAYQRECDTILFPQITASDIAAERGVTAEYVMNNWSDGYMYLDAFTELAGYGKVQDRVSAHGIDFMGIPEVDALFAQLCSDDEFDYPKQHFGRNLKRFERRCKEMAESNTSDEKKTAFLFNLIQILSYCYEFFVGYEDDPEYVMYPMRLFSAAEMVFMKATHPICLKSICMELGCDYMVSDFFPDNSLYRRIWDKNELFPDVSWSQYHLEKGLQATLPYHEKRLCGQCANATCPYRKAPSKVHQLQSSGARTPKERKDLFFTGLRQICITLSANRHTNVKKGAVANTWSLKKAGTLYAYIGFALKEHFQLSTIPWKEMAPILLTDCDANDLKVMASKIRSAIQSGKQNALPIGSQYVDEAIAKLTI